MNPMDQPKVSSGKVLRRRQEHYNKALGALADLWSMLPAKDVGKPGTAKERVRTMIAQLSILCDGGNPDDEQF